MPVQRLARSVILKLSVEALEDRRIPSVWGTSLTLDSSAAVGPGLMVDGPALVPAQVMDAPAALAERGSMTQVKAHMLEARIEDSAPLPAALPQAAAIYGARGAMGQSVADLRERLDPDWRQDLREQTLRRSSDSAGLKLTLISKHINIFAEEALLSQVAGQKQTDAKQYAGISFDIPRAMPAAMENRSELPRDAEPQTLPASAHSAGSTSGGWQILSLPAGVPLRGTEPKLVRLASVLIGTSPEGEPNSVALMPVAAGVLGDILPLDVAALEQGMQNFLEEVGAASQWVLGETAGAQRAGWLLATLVASALAAEVIHQKRRTPAMELTGRLDEDSYWSFPSRLTEFAWDQQP
jgi:hypothetical protein